MLKLKPHPGADGIVWWHVGGKNLMKIKIKRHSTGFSDLALAQQYRDELEKATQWPMPKPEPAPEAKPKLTLTEALDRWLESLHIPDDSTSRRTYRGSVMNGLIKPLLTLFSRPVTLLEEVTPEHLTALQNHWRREDYTYNSKQTYRDHSGQMFKWAVDYDYLKRNPWKTVKPLRPNKQSKDQIMLREGKDEGSATLPLDTDEGKTNWLRIQAAAIPFIEQHATKNATRNAIFQHPLNWLTLLAVMYELGLRRSDAIIFRPDWIEATKHGGSYFAMQWKTGDPVTCYLPKNLMETIRSLPLLPWRGAPSRYEKFAKKPFVPGAGLYPFYDGSSAELAGYLDTNLNRPLRELGETLGFSVKDGNSLRPHRFRDSFAVNMLNLGLSLQDISRMLGHKRLSTTEDSYTPFVISVSKAIERRQFAARQGKLFDEAYGSPRAVKGRNAIAQGGPDVERFLAA